MMESKKTSYFLIAFLCSSILLTFASYSLGTQDNLRTSQSGIFNGLYANYTFDEGVPVNSRFTYEYHSGTLYNVTWWIQGNPIPGTWLEDTQTRLTSNSSGGTTFYDGVHTPVWIFTNMSLGNSTIIVVDGGFDHPYTVVDEAVANYPGLGTINVWVLEDDWYSTHAWYEKTTGLLINGTFQWFMGSYTLTLTETNIFSPRGGGIPGFEILLVLPLIGVISFFILLRRRRILRINYK
ncbi:MAG: hypothetical protein ACFE9N_09440 [Promethearchaeota archaeon]